MPGRKFAQSGSGYRYGFNGKENDKEITGGDLNFGGRIYDSRLSRWLSVDPLQHKYANLSPYNGMGNNPILFIDPDGKTIIINAQSTTDVNKVVGYSCVLEELLNFILSLSLMYSKEINEIPGKFFRYTILLLS